MGEVGQEDNLAKLSHLTGDAILDSLHIRFERGQIYTYVGDILIAVNPFERLPLYTPEIHNQYKGGKHDGLAPHIFAIADRAFEAMVRTKLDQCFVVSGESGAGKTESTKLMVKHIVELCRSGNPELENQVIMVNPVLEAFGNAKTVMNNNSSRFGKYLELRFDKTGAITGAFMRHYLLEKSRVTMRNAGEQSFHIFYLLFAGLRDEDSNKLTALGLDKPSSHAYLTKDEKFLDQKVFDGETGKRFLTEWRECMEGFRFVKFQLDDIEDTLRALAAILHIGDIKFTGGKHDLVSIDGASSASLGHIASLLGVDRAELDRVMVYSTSKTRNEVITKQYTGEEAVDNRDATAKMIYGRLFEWIFATINQLLAGKHDSTDGLILGLLDIFGFENFKVNSLEQMCINITNEQLQNYFNHHIFVMEQKEYESEGVDFSKIEHVDNQPTLDLFLSKNPPGIFSILNEQSRFPNADDKAFTQKCAQALKTHGSRAFKPTRSEHDLKFTCVHYAGEVEYKTEDFLEKNRDKLSADVMRMLRNGKNNLVAQLFALGEGEEEETGGVRGKKKATTLAAIFQQSLHDLVDRLNTCQPHFVRCIKPNPHQNPKVWDSDLVTRQLTYAGVLETIKIRKLGYSFRLPFETFVKRFKILAYKDHENPPRDVQTARRICDFVKLDNYQMGKSKVFMKYYHADMLASRAKEHTDALVMVQRVVKGYIARTEHMRRLQEKRKRDRSLRNLFNFIDEATRSFVPRFRAKVEEDKSEAANRVWLKKVKEQAAMKQAAEEAAEAERRQALERAMREEPTKTRTKSVGGFFVWQRNEHLDLKVGPLEYPWMKKVDERTGRFYFKNVEEKYTSWIDPRTFDTRPHNAAETEGDELPYGWDEAETDQGVTFYINHLTGTHHKEHPREELRKMEAQLARHKAASSDKEQEALTTLNQLREKRRVVLGMLSEATEDDERDSLKERLEAVENAIEKQQAELEALRRGSQALFSAISQFTQRKTRVDPDAAVKKYARIWMLKALKRAPRKMTTLF